ncbi:uncharacterized protein LOC134203514 [Armigeres subalbatus]|uniref:uncharacterized protein LOC134203514 n=1 Tax=Armigeres subalbatus TaxID=124917 RepID=UPI002ED36327
MHSNKKTVKELRGELVTLGAKITGNKNVLEKRLENWRKHNLSSSLVVAQPIPAVDETVIEDVKKFDAIENLPADECKWLTFEIIRGYFNERGALNSFKEGRKLHVANHLRKIGFGRTSVGNIQIRCYCKAAMKKSVLYQVIVELAISKVIAKCNCTCPAGRGNSAACKHAGALLLCLECYLETVGHPVLLSCSSGISHPSLRTNVCRKHQSMNYSVQKMLLLQVKLVLVTALVLN